MIHKISAAIQLAKVNKELGQPLYKEKYPVYNTKYETTEDWWDNLNNSEDRHDAGMIAFDHGKFSANYLWDDRINSKFKTLKKSQKNHLKYSFKRKDTKYEFLPVESLISKI